MLAVGTGFIVRNWLPGRRSLLNPEMKMMSSLGNHERTHLSVAVTTSIYSQRQSAWAYLQGAVLVFTSQPK